jgi:cardiolipin synthase
LEFGIRPPTFYNRLVRYIPPPSTTDFRWLKTGQAAFPAMLEAINLARASIRLEMYIYSAGELGTKFRDAMVKAATRGVQVRVMIDAFGSLGLPNQFWMPLIDAGGDFQWFNPLKLGRISYRNHRKLLVCDDHIAIFGGLNIAPEYDGDGITSGWRDLAIEAKGALAGELGEAFDGSWALARTEHRALLRFRKSRARSTSSAACWRILLGGPGRGYNYMKSTLAADLAIARKVQILCAYFLPTWRLRREMIQVIKRGGTVDLILAGKSDVRLSQLASQRLYRMLLKRGVRIHEYQPQILHAKLFIIDDQVYVGSSNLDTRSLNINYELLVRITDADVVAEAREIFADALEHSRSIERTAWRKARSFWTKLLEEWAYFFLARVDPYVAGVRRPLIKGK